MGLYSVNEKMMGRIMYILLWTVIAEGIRCGSTGMIVPYVCGLLLSTFQEPLESDRLFMNVCVCVIH